MKLVVLWSDALVFLLVVALVSFFYLLRKDLQTRERWRQVFSSSLGMVTFTVIIAYVTVALLDSLHFRRALPSPEGLVTEEVFYDNQRRGFATNVTPNLPGSVRLRRLSS